MRKGIINKIILLFTLFLSVKTFGQSASDFALIYPFSNIQDRGIFMRIPSNFTSSIIYDPLTNNYIIQDKIGTLNYGGERVMCFSEYQKYIQNNLINDYWNLHSKSRRGNQTSVLGLPKLYIPGKSFDRVFGGNAVDIRPQGSTELIFGLKINDIEKFTVQTKETKL